MANDILISYSLRETGKDYQPLYEAISGLGAWAAIHETLWYVKSEFESDYIIEQLKQYVGNNDVLFVVNVSNESVWEINAAPEVADQINNYWAK